MSYVHFLDVFDPVGLPAGLSDREAAEQARNLRLSQPSPRLLTRIRKQPPGITVNVVGGQGQQPVEWVAGNPPSVQGEGANCALWTLVQGMMPFAYLALKWFNRKKDRDDERGFLGLPVKPWVAWLVVIGGLALLMARSG